MSIAKKLELEIVASGSPEAAGATLLRLLNEEREIAFAMGWNARQRLREDNVVPTKMDYDKELETAKARWAK
jgi:hypothetical protein